MNEDEKGVKPNAGDAPIPEKSATPAPAEAGKEKVPDQPAKLPDGITEQQLNDLVQGQAALLDELEQTRSDRDNYQQGMLVAKKKIKDLKDQGFEIPDDEPGSAVSEDRIVSRVVEAIKPMLPTQPKNDDVIANLRKTNNELITALKNRQQVVPATVAPGSGSDGDKPEQNKENPDNYWSKEQLADLKARGLDPETVRKNTSKYHGG